MKQQQATFVALWFLMGTDVGDGWTTGSRGFRGLDSGILRLQMLCANLFDNPATSATT